MLKKSYEPAYIYDRDELISFWNYVYKGNGKLDLARPLEKVNDGDVMDDTMAALDEIVEEVTYELKRSMASFGAPDPSVVATYTIKSAQELVMHELSMLCRYIESLKDDLSVEDILNTIQTIRRFHLSHNTDITNIDGH